MGVNVSWLRRGFALWLAVMTAIAVLVIVPGVPDANAQTVTTYTDVAASAGLNFTHDVGTLCDPVIGNGSAWADYDGDGDIDGYTTNRGGVNAMWENVGDTDSDGIPNFVDTAAAAGIEGATASLGAVFIDYDNDGDQDLYVTEHSGNTLFRNDGDLDSSGDPDFTDVTATAGLADGGRAITASWADFNQDGFLDVYVSKHRKCNNDPDNQDALYQANGDGTFSDVTSYLCGGAAPPCDAVIGLGFTAGWFDADGDGDQDLALINDVIDPGDKPNKFWINQGSDGSGGWLFDEVSAINGTEVFLNGMGLGLGDYDNDGDFDMAFSNAGPAEFLENVGNGGPTPDGIVDFVDESLSTGVENVTKTTWGTVFFDHDNDGDVDLFFAAGGGMTGQTNVLLDNNGDSTFTDVSTTVGLDDNRITRHAAIVDFDGDGWMDVFSGTYGGVVGLYHNNGNVTNNSMTITVEGTESNRDGIGTKLELITSDRTQLRQITSGPTHGGGDQKIAQFGLGTETSGTLIITWPNGVRQNLGTVGTGAHHFVEPSSSTVVPFEDVTTAAGVTFTHDEGIICAPAIGTGSAWSDYDADGDADLYVTNRGGANSLFENIGDTNSDGIPEFTDNAVAAGVDLPAEASLSSVFIDYDNDGDQDMYVTNWEGNTLFENVGDTDSDGVPNYVDITATAGVADGGRAITSAWGDFNNDSYLDFYVAKHRKCGSDPDNQDHLFMSNGDGTFTDVTSYMCAGLATCEEVEGLGFTAGWLDYDSDNDLDLYVVNDDLCTPSCPNYMWRNDGPGGAGGAWTFTEVGASIGARIALNGMGLAMGDYNNTGDLDLAFTNVGPMVIIEDNGDNTFTNVSDPSNVDALTDSVTWGTVFFDHDNDGDLDLYTAAGTTGLTGYPNIFLDNNGDSTFTDTSIATGLNDAYNGRALSIVDFDEDGWVDVYVANFNDPSMLYRNTGGDSGNTNNWLQVTVEGTESNRDGIGAKLTLTTATATHYWTITSGPTHGGGDYRAAFFGLGAEASGTLVIDWPNGVTQNLGTVTAGQALHFVEPLATSGDIGGHVFEDLDGDGTDNGGTEPGLAGVSVTITDSASGVTAATTDANGDFLVTGIPTGSATVDFDAGRHYTLTTANDSQNVTVLDSSTVSTADVGYENIPAYVQVTAATGTAFSHVSGGTLCTPPIGSGNAWADYDGDGDLDLYLTNRDGANAMFENVGDTNSDGLPDFVDMAAAIGIDDAARFSHGAVFVDYDNDGDQDLYVTNWSDTVTPGTGNNALWENLGDTDLDGNPNFQDIAASAGVLGEGRGITASWGDYDNDGFLDLYIAKHKQCSDLDNSQDRLYHANGDGTFTDVSSSLCEGLATCPELEGYGFVAGFVDYDNDNDLDIFLVNDNIGGQQETKMWENIGPDGSGGWDFNEVSAAIGAEIAVNGMGLGIGDYNNDGWFDLAFSDIGPARLLISDGDGTFTNVSGISGVEAGTDNTTTWGTAFLDYDLDGYEDLYFAAGQIFGGGDSPNRLLLNNGDETFADISAASGLDDADQARASAMADFDKDGWIDMWVGNYNGPGQLYRNAYGDQGNTNNSITVTVEGTDSNRDGIGTKLHLTAGGMTMMRDISSGRTHGGGDEKAAWFGIGSETTGDLVITWPNGTVENVGTIGAGAHHFVEPAVGPTGDVAGHVFEDLDGDGTDNGGTEPGLANVAVAAVDALGNPHNTVTDGNGDFTLNGLDVGLATVTFTTPSGYTLTTGNDVQNVTVVDGATVNTTDVGYLPDPPPPSGDIAGHVFEDLDGSGIEDGAEGGLAGVAVDVVDVNGDPYSTTTDANGDYTITGVAVGAATVTFTTPAGYALTTGNDVQNVTVVEASTVNTSDVGYQPTGSTVDIVAMLSNNKNIDQGQTKWFRVQVTGYQTGGVFTFSGNGLTVNQVRGVAANPDEYRIRVVASQTADPGFHDLTVTNPDGGTDTLPDAVNVIGVITTQGDVTGHVFTDNDGNGIEDGTDTGLSGVGVTITDAGGGIHTATTDVNGDYTVTGVATGNALVEYDTPAGHALTTGNASQTVTVVDQSTIATADVGYQPIPAGDITGHVFSDIDGNGIEDGSDIGLANVAVTVTAADGSVFNATTDGNGDFTVTGVGTGDATVTFVAPAGTTLTTGNDVQVVTVVDGATVSTSDVGYQPAGFQVLRLGNGNATIDQGQNKRFQVTMEGYVDGGSFSFSGTGLTVNQVADTANPDVKRIRVVADATAPLGFQDLIVVSGDGSTATLTNAIQVTSQSQQTML